MSDLTPNDPQTPATGPAVGQDEWVSRHGEHQQGRAGIVGVLETRLSRVPWWAWLVVFLACFSLLPVFESSGYVRLVAFQTVLYMLLALGLNVVVGWGGLLDLGFVAFYGLGAYLYAFFDSDQFGLHFPTLVSIPLIVVIGAIIGLLLGLPSRRLSGDYLAIVTLFFLQLFQTLTTNGDNVFGHNITGGPFGLLNVDPFNFFGHQLAIQHNGIFAVSYLYVALALFAVVFVALRFVNNSRTGRAWRSLREDSLATEAMGMPVNWLKLLSFAFGAAVAALTGTLFARTVGKRLPARVLLRAADHRLHDGDPRRIREPGRSRARRGDRRCRCSSCCATPASRGSSSSSHWSAGWCLPSASRGGWQSSAARRSCSASPFTGLPGRSTPAGCQVRRPGASRVRSPTGWSCPTHLARWVAPVSYVGVIAAILLLTLVHGRLRLVLLAADALPRRVRLGERDARRSPSRRGTSCSA